MEPTDTDFQLFLSNGTMPLYKSCTTSLTKRISQITKLSQCNAKHQYRFMCCCSEQFSCTAHESEDLYTTLHYHGTACLTKGRASLPVWRTCGCWWSCLTPCACTCFRDHTPRTQHGHAATGEQDTASLPFSHQQASFFISVWTLEFQIKCPSPTAKKRSN